MSYTAESGVADSGQLNKAMSAFIECLDTYMHVVLNVDEKN
jgi:hypothetical protein